MKYFLLIIALAAQSAFAADKQPPIADPIVEKAIRVQLKKPKGNLTKADLVKGDAPQTREEKQWLELISKPIVMQFTATDGRKVNLAKMRGKVVLIYFCASWCPPCVHEYPELKATYEKLHDQGVEFIGISLERTREQLDKYTREKKIPWPQFYDEAGWNNVFMEQFQVKWIPRMLLVGRDGRIVDQDARQDLDRKILKALAQPDPIK